MPLKDLPAFHIKISKLSHLLDKDADKTVISPFELSVLAHRFFGLVEILMRGELDRIHYEALLLADKYWEHNRLHRGGADWGKFGVRVRRPDRIPKIIWYKNSWLNGKVYSKDIPKPFGCTYYPISYFGAASPWERELIKNLERRFKSLRIEINALKSLQQTLNKMRGNTSRHYYQYWESTDD